MNMRDVRPWRISLRSFLGITTVIAVGCVAMAYASEWWLLVISAISLLIFMSAVVVVILDRKGRQAFAIGFLLCGAMHWAALKWSENVPTRLLLEKSYYFVGHASFEVGRNSPSGTGAVGGANSVGLLRNGDTGAPVAALQAALNEQPTARRQLQVDGDFGNRTEMAVTEFQRLQGHQTNGIVTLSTWRALGPSATRTLKLNGVSGFLSATPGEQYVRIGCELVTLLFAYIGGHVALAARVGRWNDSVPS